MPSHGVSNRNELRNARAQLTRIYAGSEEWALRVKNMTSNEVYNTLIRQRIAIEEAEKYVTEAAAAPHANLHTT